MSTLYVLATADPELAAAWERQLPPGRSSLRLSPQALSGGTQPGFAAVVILDATAEPDLPVALARCPTIYVGEPRSVPFEQARMSARARTFLSYEESVSRLGEFLPLVEEIAEKQSMMELLLEKARRTEATRAPVRAVTPDPAEWWDFFEGAIDNLDSRDRLLSEFRRASRHLLRASHAVFFLRETDGFRADRGTSFFDADDPIVAFLENHPAVIDGANWDAPADPVAELAVRNRLALWGARLLVPIHDNGRLLGLIVLGVRDDGQPYDENDRMRAVIFARLLRQCLVKAAQLARLNNLAEQLNLGAKYLPRTLVLGADESAPRHVPVVVRDLIGRARRSREVCRVAPMEGQPFRASAGVIVETGGVWAYWEEASGEVHDAAARQRAGRRELLRELALTFSHEMGNSLVSLATFRQAAEGQTAPAALLHAAKADIARLEALNQHLGMMQLLHEAERRATDVRELMQQIGAELELRVEVGPDPVPLNAAPRLLEFALRALIGTLAENRADLGVRDLTLQVRSTGEGAERTALLSVKGKRLELEGILPEPVLNGVPNQGRLAVFIAKEIIRLHHGEIHAGPGIEGTEILISLRSL
ncbi:GAF domain-containing protein [Horticoccus luteus]|uniref:GAF domain-containing protein n=1 Tax=Horticoccus luteus TaxID=2862869 RepID=A0A8F9XIQ9_9BACT|nr:GAF domain-containing protein [Horticoccus luteus]QYM77858.1 GAF domain-containing protein [Horticoccus luteus]